MHKRLNRILTGARAWQRVLAGVLVVLFPVAVAGALFALLRRPTVDLDPAALARREVRMWQAYYDGKWVRLGGQLITLLHRHLGFSYWDAAQTARHLKRAARTFRKHRGDYNQTVLPHLAEAYASVAQATGWDFDPAEAARAELEWWVARRDPQRSQPDNVGEGIGRLYRLVVPEAATPEAFGPAGRLRAEAANLRDDTRDVPNWAGVERLLVESYTHFRNGVHGE